MKRPPGLILYAGPSRLTGAPIVAVLTFPRRRNGAAVNAKTGGMCATWILDASQSPIDALRSGADRNVCGTCPHREGMGVSCYVNVGVAPSIVWHAWRRGTYARLTRRTLAYLAGRAIRIGSYGDPVAVPLSVWEHVLSVASSHTGYTHAWRRSIAAPYKAIIMASCDSESDRADALAMGWRTFRVRMRGERILPGEFVCPASVEAGHRLTCAECRACDGATHSPRAASPVIYWHGAPIAHGYAERVYRETMARRQPGRFSLPIITTTTGRE